jgi:hypothetical protein
LQILIKRIIVNPQGTIIDQELNTPFAYLRTLADDLQSSGKEGGGSDQVQHRLLFPRRPEMVVFGIKYVCLQYFFKSYFLKSFEVDVLSKRLHQIEIIKDIQAVLLVQDVNMNTICDQLKYAMLRKEVDLHAGPKSDRNIEGI